MEYKFNDLQKYIVEKLIYAFTQRHNTTLKLVDLLKQVIDEYGLYMYYDKSGKDVLKIYGKEQKCGYNIIIDAVFLFEMMSEHRIVIYYEQADSTYNLESLGIELKEYELQGKISGSVVDFLKKNLGKSIWISPEIENFAKNGYVSEEIALAREQSKDAKKSIKQATLAIIISIISMIASIVIPLLCETCNCCC